MTPSPEQDAPSGSTARSASITAIFLTVMLDMLAFGMFIPDIQLRAESLHATDLQTGLTLAIFSIAQLLTAPILGRLSDVSGRRSVLLISSALSLVSYIIYANLLGLGGALGISPLYVIWFARALAGIAGANIGVAFAYVSDVTTPENRAKGMGIVGMAFGIGFVFGPPLGALLLNVGHDSPAALGYVGAALVAANIIYIWKWLPESRKPEDHKETPSLLANAQEAFLTPALRNLLIMFFAINIGFTNLETTYFRLLADPKTIFNLPAEEAKTAGAIILTLVGLGIAFCQGFLVQKLQPKLGEVKLLRAGLLGVVFGLFLCPILPLWVPAMLVVVLLAFGNGMASPNLNGLVSRAAPIAMQGGVFGITQALGALARCIGPIVSNYLFGLNPQYPYMLGAGIVALPALAAWTLKQPKEGEQETEMIVAH